MAKRRRVPRGTVRPMSDAQTDEFTLPTLEDIELFRTVFQRYARPKYRDLIDALPFEEVLDIDQAA